MIDAAVRLLSLCNQLDASTRRGRLDFKEGESGVMGYLNRMGFFDQLSRSASGLFTNRFSPSLGGEPLPSAAGRRPTDRRHGRANDPGAHIHRADVTSG
jgi:hypothetical protein